ncbi:MAG: hypothetical protein HFI34_03735 [Lachnospiraceae bacterium]|nr:hypothetical protein [Lachnospiraceae bacterium]
MTVRAGNGLRAVHVEKAGQINAALDNGLQSGYDPGADPKLGAAICALKKKASGKKSVDEMFTDKSVKHLEEIDGFDKKHGGIKGAHTMDSFNKFSKEVRPVQIVNKTKISNGIYEIKYKVAKIDRGNPVINADGTYDFVNAEYVKTVIDTSELDIDKIVSMAKEAFDSREVYETPGKQKYINGISKDAVKFEGWINTLTNELDSFYPVREWQFDY